MSFFTIGSDFQHRISKIQVYILIYGLVTKNKSEEKFTHQLSFRETNVIICDVGYPLWRNVLSVCESYEC